MTTNLLIFVLAAALGACAKTSTGEEGGGARPGVQAGDTAAGARPGGQQAGAGQADDAAMAEARQLFAIRCATCHGQTGRGDGPVAANLNPKPRDYSDKAWQESATDEEIKKVIVEGGPAVGKSVLMTASPDLAQKPELLEAMVRLIRSFAE